MAGTQVTTPIGVPIDRPESRLPFYVDVLRRLVREKPLGLIGGVLVVMYFIAAIGAPVIAPFGPNELGAGPRLGGPTLDNYMGTDNLGRDIFSRVVYGARLSLMVGITTVTFAVIIGVFTGSVAGYLGGWADNIIMRIMDVVLAFPSLILAIAVVTVLGPGLINALLAISIVSIPAYARVARSGVLSVKEEDFVMADRVLGVAPVRILFRRILPNALAPLIVQATLGIGTAILDAAALSFLGLGAQPPTPEWGAMLGAERNQIFTAPHLVFYPGIAIMITVLAFNLLGDGLRDALDPRLDR